MNNAIRKTKIICTIGPSSDDPDILRQLMREGMNVARLNFSHGDHAEQKQRADLIKKLREEENLPVALLLDTKGPEIRTLEFKNHRVMLHENAEVVIRHGDVLGTEQEFSVTYKDLHKELYPGASILIDDGLVGLKVLAIEGEDIRCKVINSGEIADHKSINLPDIDTNLPAMTDQDMMDIRFAIDNQFEFIAVSFVRKAQDIIDIRRLLDKMGGNHIHLIAKIENRQGVRNFEQIIDAADGVMVARGDMGVELPAYEVPTIQKMIIDRCYHLGKPSITATQMLDSMIRNPRPTRAEVSDVANAILDGTSAIMLSGETASGSYPVEALRMMAKIAFYTEANHDYWKDFTIKAVDLAPGVTNAISHAVCTTAMDLKAKAIVAVTHSGRTARVISGYRPNCPIIAPTVSRHAQRQLNLSWGVVPFLAEQMHTTDELFEMALRQAKDSGLVSNGDLVVITGGTPVGMAGTTNTLKVSNIGQIISHGVGIPTTDKKTVSSEALVLNKLTTVTGNAQSMDCILVAKDTDNSLIDLMRHSSAIVVENPESNCHAVTVGKALEIPVVYGCTNVTNLVKNGQIITVDPVSGIIS